MKDFPKELDNFQRLVLATNSRVETTIEGEKIIIEPTTCSGSTCVRIRYKGKSYDIAGEDEQIVHFDTIMNRRMASLLVDKFNKNAAWFNAWKQALIDNQKNQIEYEKYKLADLYVKMKFVM